MLRLWLINFLYTVPINNFIYIGFAKNLAKSFYIVSGNRIWFGRMTTDSTPTVVPPPMPVMEPITVSHGEKPEKLNGTEFKRWQQKMMFYLTTLNLACFLQEDAPALKENKTNRQVVAAMEAWKHVDFLCRNYFLNGLEKTLYNVYCAFNTARELWESLDKKYKTEDARLKKFVVGKFLDYKMLDTKTVISQIQDLQVILHDIHAEGMSLSESFQVASIIEKLPPLWKEFKNYLKHKRKEMRLEDLIMRLRIEEDNRASEKKAGNGFLESKANVVEQGHTSHNHKKRKHNGNGPKQVPTKKFQGKIFSQQEYAQEIGSLMYVMNGIRPDIAYSISKLSRYTSNPGPNHWKAIVRVLRYLKYTQNYGLHYSKYPAILKGYCDANWISDTKGSKSTSGYLFTLSGGAVSWKSSKKTCIARSTMEYEFIALDKAGEEAEWLRHFLEDIQIWPQPVPAICIHCDSQSVIGRAQSHIYNGKSQHICRRHNTVRQLLSNSIMTIEYIRSKENIADPLTKGLTREQVSKSSRGIGLKPIH